MKLIVKYTFFYSFFNNQTWKVLVIHNFRQPYFVSTPYYRKQSMKCHFSTQYLHRALNQYTYIHSTYIASRCILSRKKGWCQKLFRILMCSTDILEGLDICKIVDKKRINNCFSAIQHQWRPTGSLTR